MVIGFLACTCFLIQPIHDDVLCTTLCVYAAIKLHQGTGVVGIYCTKNAVREKFHYIRWVQVSSAIIKNHFPFAFPSFVDFGFAVILFSIIISRFSRTLARARNKQQRKLKRVHHPRLSIHLEYIFITNCCYEKYLDARQSCER